MKLRKKITTTVQVLTHLKEKLQFVQAENSDQRNILRSVEAHAAQVRYDLSLINLQHSRAGGQMVDAWGWPGYCVMFLYTDVSSYRKRKKFE